MKRLIASVLIGFAIPLIYSMVAGPLSSYIDNQFLKYLTGVPVRWPVLIYPKLMGYPFPVLLTVIIVCNVFVYGTAAHFILWKLGSRRRLQQLDPPAPPSFAQD